MGKSGLALAAALAGVLSLAGAGASGQVTCGPRTGGRPVAVDPTKVPQVTAVCQYVSHVKAMMYGKPSVTVNFYNPTTKLAWHGWTMDMSFAKTLEGMKKGDYVKVSSGDYMGGQVITACTPYKLKPNEDHPDAFIFQICEEVQVNRKPVQIVVLEKLGVDIKLPLLTHQDETGKVAVDPNVLAAASTLKKGELVEVDTQVFGGKRSVRYIAPFSPPIEGKFSKMELTGKEGDRKGAIEYTDGSETKKLEIGMVGPAKYQEPDPTVVASAKMLKAGDPVQIKTRKAGDKDVVMRISRGKLIKDAPKDAPKDRPAKGD